MKSDSLVTQTSIIEEILVLIRKEEYNIRNFVFTSLDPPPRYLLIDSESYNRLMSEYPIDKFLISERLNKETGRFETLFINLLIIEVMCEPKFIKIVRNLAEM